MDKPLSNTEIIKKVAEIGIYIPIIPNEHLVLHWWDIINDSLFNGVLNKPKKIVIKNFNKDTYGWCAPYGKAKKDGKRCITVGISLVLKNMYEFLCILIHEMVHSWEWIVNNDWREDVKHGKDFYAWKFIITNNYDLPLRAKYNFS